MSDLIRREDALKAAEAGPSFYMIQTDTGFRESRGGAFAIRSDISQALLALPAVQPDLTDPVVVHANMVRGTIAKPTLDQIIHLYGVDALCRALVPAIVKEAAFATPHVNEPPKSEHDARNMLTPATKGERDD